MKLFPLLFACLTTTSLISCSSEDGSDNEGGNSSSYQLNFNAVIENVCKVQSPATNDDIMVIIHNDDFSTKEFLYPNNSGDISYSSSNERETFTIVESDPDVSTTDLFLRTYVDAKLADFGQIVISSNNETDCICQTTTSTINLPNVFNQSISYITGITDYVMDDQQPTGSTTSVTGQYCTNLDGEGPTVFVELNTNSGGYISYDSDYQINSSIDVNIAGVAPSFQVLTIDNSPIDYITSLTYTNDDAIGYNYTFSEFSGNDLQSYQFNDVIGYRYSFGHSTDLETELGDVSYLTNKAIYSSTILDDDIVTLLHVLDLSSFDADEFSYDFSSSDDFDVAKSIIRINEQDFYFYWSINTPLNGQLPNIDNMNLGNFDDFNNLNQIATSLSFEFGANGYKTGVNGYDDYVTFVNNGLSNSARLQAEQWLSSTLRFTIDDLGELSSGLKPAISVVLDSNSL